MAGMNEVEALLQPSPLGSLHPGQGACKVCLVLRPHMLCLEQQDDFRLQIVQAVRRGRNDVPTGTADTLVTPVHP